MVYSKNELLGSYLEETVAWSLSMCGYHVEEHKVTDEGVDVRASNLKGDIVCECWNWKKRAYPTPKRIESVIENLSSYPSSNKFLITAHKVDFGEFRKELKRYGITVITLGKQLLSKSIDALKLVTRKLHDHMVLYYSINYTNRKRKIKRNILSSVEKMRLESVFQTSMTVLFCFFRAFCANFSPKCSATRFSVTCLIKKERKKSDRNDK